MIQESHMEDLMQNTRMCMVSYILDTMIVADSKFNEEDVSAVDGLINIVVIEEILYESRNDKKYDFLKKYSVNNTSKECVNILKTQVVNQMIDAGALLPDKGVGETMIAVEYWCKDLGKQVGLFDRYYSQDKVVVTNDKRAKLYFKKHNNQ